MPKQELPRRSSSWNGSVWACLTTMKHGCGHGIQNRYGHRVMVKPKRIEHGTWEHDNINKHEFVYVIYIMHIKTYSY